MQKIIKYKNLVTIVTLLLLLCGLYFKNLELKWQLIYEKSIPDVELINYLSFDSNNRASGSLTGFVVFDDKEKQPKNLRQYIKITALDNLSSNNKQQFYLIDIIKMNTLPPRYFDPVFLSVINTSGDIITLVDAENNQYLINTETKEVSMFDATKDVTRLITSGSKFTEYMLDLLK